MSQYAARAWCWRYVGAVVGVKVLLPQGKSSISDNLDSGALSIVPWRSSKVNYTSVRGGVSLYFLLL